MFFFQTDSSTQEKPDNKKSIDQLEEFEPIIAKANVPDQKLLLCTFQSEKNAQQIVSSPEFEPAYATKSIIHKAKVQSMSKYVVCEYLQQFFS